GQPGPGGERGSGRRAAGAVCATLNEPRLMRRPALVALTTPVPPANPLAMSRPASLRFSSTAAFASLALALTAGLLGCKKTEPAAAPAAAPAANAAPATGPGAFGKGAIAGNVKFTGKPPEMRPVTTPDPFCARQPIKEEDV